MQSPRGEKTTRIIAAVEAQVGPFRVADRLQAGPEASLDMVRHVLGQLRNQARLGCLGTGRAAKWQKKETG